MRAGQATMAWPARRFAARGAEVARRRNLDQHGSMASATHSAASQAYGFHLRYQWLDDNAAPATNCLKIGLSVNPISRTRLGRTRRKVSRFRTEVCIDCAGRGLP